MIILASSSREHLARAPFICSSEPRASREAALARCRHLAAPNLSPRPDEPCSLTSSTLFRPKDGAPDGPLGSTDNKPGPANAHRPPTISAANRLGTSKANTERAVELEQEQQNAELLPANSGGPDESLGTLLKANSNSNKQQQQQTNTGADRSFSRSRFAGYLASKFSNLTNLTGSGANTNGLNQPTHPQSSSSSEPPSPLNKRQIKGSSSQTPTNSYFGHYPSNCFASVTNSGSAATGSTKRPSNNAAPTNKRNSNETPLFQVTKDYAGCDFILFLESTSKLNLAQSSSTAGHVAGGSTSASGSGVGVSGGGTGANQLNHSANNNPLIIHLVAPNLQEKAAWMSDISQVSLFGVFPLFRSFDRHCYSCCCCRETF